MSKPACAPPRPSSSLPLEQPDWVFAANSLKGSDWATQFHLVTSRVSDGERRVHLTNRLSSGVLNFVGNAVRGHCSSSPKDRSAFPNEMSELRITEVATTKKDDCETPPRVRFEFTSQATRGKFLHVQRDGVLSTASASACNANDAPCDFDIVVEMQQQQQQQQARDAGDARSSGYWVGLRSVLTGRLVRLHHSAMPELPSWDGIQGSSAHKPKPRAASQPTSGGKCQCPIRGGGRPPAGWSYNCSLWAPLIKQYLSPWREGNVTATVLDMAFWKPIYGVARAHAVPGAHVSSRGGKLLVRENVEYRMPLFKDMMRTVHRHVALPDVEFVASLWDHPKASRQTPLPIFVHYADASHSDVPIPAPWSWDDKKHDFPQPWTKITRAQCSTPWAKRVAKLYFRGGCNGPTRGWRGPLWQFYPRKRANRLSYAHPSLIDAGTYDHCDSPKLSKLEWGWDQNMESEMGARGRKKPIEKFSANCKYKYLLHVDGNLASSRLASEMYIGSTVFKQDSFSNECAATPSTYLRSNPRHTRSAWPSPFCSHVRAHRSAATQRVKCPVRTHAHTHTHARARARRPAGTFTRCSSHMSTTFRLRPIYTTCPKSSNGRASIHARQKLLREPASASHKSTCTCTPYRAIGGSCLPLLLNCRALCRAPTRRSAFIRFDLCASSER